MQTRRAKPESRSISAAGGIAFGLVLLCAVVASAASYSRITLKELTTRSKAVVEVEVLKRTYPQMAEGQKFPRTMIDLKIIRTLKGSLGDSFVLDTPGGINGDVISVVPDAPDFKVGERAIVFVKEPEPNHFYVQDLGLGKFNVVNRDGKMFVENPICPKAIGAGKEMKDQDDLDANLITRSIPYPVFCSLVETYAAGNTPAVKPAELAATLAPSQSHVTPNQAMSDLAVVADSRAKADADKAAAESHRAWMGLGALVLVSAFAALAVVARRRKAKSGQAGTRNVMLILGAALLGGAVLGGAGVRAFVAFDQKTIWNLDRVVNGKLAEGRIIWKQSSATSKTNAQAFAGVQRSFDKWEAVVGSRLAFTAGGATSTAVNNSNDAENVIAWTPNPSNDFSQNTLGICFSSFTTGSISNFVDGDIIFNDRDFNWSSSGEGNVDSVSLHEIGHFIGLNHTTDNKTVMFPFDSGFTDLSFDEIAAAIALYPDGVKPPPAPPTPVPTPTPTPPKLPPPTALADGSPLFGLPGTTVNFTSEGSISAAPERPIVLFEWDFGDGAKGIGPTISHTFTAIGTYTVSLTVTDAAGMFATSMVTVKIGNNSSALKAQFKLVFVALGKDQFTATLDASGASALTKKPRAVGGEILHGALSIGDQPWLFDFDPFKLKSVNKFGPKVTVKNGLLTVAIKAADLRDVLAGHGAINDTISGLDVPVPLTLWFNDGKGTYVFAEIPFRYFATKGKTGTGKF